MHLLRGAGKADPLKFAPELLRILAALIEAAMQMPEIRIEHARLRLAHAVPGEARGEGVLAHRGPGQAGLAIDAPKRLSLRMAATHVIVGRFPSAAGRSSREHLGRCAWEGRDAPDRGR